MLEREEMPAARVLRLRRELIEAQKLIDSCRHEYATPTRAERQTYESVFDHFEPHGSDPEPIYKHYPKTEYGWERTCVKCGYSEYTAATKPKVVGVEPDFGGRER